MSKPKLLAACLLLLLVGSVLHWAWRHEQSFDTVAAQTVSASVSKSTAKKTAIRKLAAADSILEANRALQGFFDLYNVNVRIRVIPSSDSAKTWANWSTLSSANLKKLKSYGKLLLQEWAKYPAAWIAETELDDIMLVKKLSVDGQRRAGMPDPDGDDLYYDIGYSGDFYLREVLHHEYGHLIEYNHYGQYAYPSPRWEGFNPAGFTYFGAGQDAYNDPNFCACEHPRKGFATYYAQYALEEDKAEVYAYLMTTRGYKKLQKWAKTDSRLRDKVVYYKRFIKNKLPAMNSTYWARIH